jgi:hypothetical protein
MKKSNKNLPKLTATICLAFSLVKNTYSYEEIPNSYIYNGIRSIAVGSIAGAAEVALDQPLFNIKTALQQGKKIDWHPRALWNASCTNMASMIPTTALQVCGNDVLNKIYKDLNNGKNPDNLDKTALAVMAGFGSSLVCGPSEMIMTHQMHKKTGMLPTINHLKDKYGKLILTRGLLPTGFRDGGFTCGYTAMPGIINENINNEPGSLILSGMICASITHPFDTIKTKMQTKVDHKKFGSMVYTAQDIYKNEGIQGFYKGLTPRGLRVICAISFLNCATSWLEKNLPN